MAARATFHRVPPPSPTYRPEDYERSALPSSTSSRSSDDASRCLLLALSHDELGVIVDGLADPLQPVVAVALSSTCEGLRTPLRAALEVLQERHARAVALCRKLKMSCAAVRVAEKLGWYSKGLTAYDMATLAMILQTNGLPKLKRLYIERNYFGGQHLAVLFGALGPGALPSLEDLPVFKNDIGPLGAEAFAAAITRGAMPKLRIAAFYNNPIGNQGVAALKASLRKRELWFLGVMDVGLDDDGVSSLMSDLDKDDFKALERLDIGENPITDRGCATITTAINRGALPALLQIFTKAALGYELSEETCEALHQAITTRIPQ